MKTMIRNNWRAKLISLLLATTLWYLIKKNVATTPSRSDYGIAPATERRAIGAH
jgi:YbbR domain-containing protein